MIMILLISIKKHGPAPNRTNFLKELFLLRLLKTGLDRLCEFIISKGSGSYVNKKDLKRAYRQFPIHPKDYKYLGFMHVFKIYLMNSAYNHLPKKTVILLRGWFALGFWWIPRECFWSSGGSLIRSQNRVIAVDRVWLMVVGRGSWVVVTSRGSWVWVWV